MNESAIVKNACQHLSVKKLTVGAASRTGRVSIMPHQKYSMKCLILLVIATHCYAATNEFVRLLTTDTNCLLRVKNNGLAAITIAADEGVSNKATLGFKPSQTLDIDAALLKFFSYSHTFESGGIRPVHQLLAKCTSDETTMKFSIFVPQEGNSTLIVEEESPPPFHRLHSAPVLLSKAQCFKLKDMLIEAVELRYPDRLPFPIPAKAQPQP